MPPSMRKQAWENLVAEGTNKLCAAGLSLAYADVSDEQKKCLGMTEEAGYTASFNIGEVPCVAASTVKYFGGRLFYYRGGIFISIFFTYLQY